jgi:hypothetical protein
MTNLQNRGNYIKYWTVLRYGGITRPTEVTAVKEGTQTDSHLTAVTNVSKYKLVSLHG